PELTENRALRTRLIESLATIAGEFRDRVTKVNADFPIEPISAEFIIEPAFNGPGRVPTRAWGSQCSPLMPCTCLPAQTAGRRQSRPAGVPAPARPPSLVMARQGRSNQPQTEPLWIIVRFSR